MPVMNRKARVYEQGGGTVTTLDSVSNTYVVVGNSATSNLASNGEFIDSAYISRIVYGTANDAYVTVSRGANLVSVLQGTGELLLDGLPITLYPTANIVVTVSGSPAFIEMELKTESHFG